MLVTELTGKVAYSTAHPQYQWPIVDRSRTEYVAPSFLLRNLAASNTNTSFFHQFIIASSYSRNYSHPKIIAILFTVWIDVVHG